MSELPRANPDMNAQQPVRRRRRPAVVCTECRRRKIACDRKLPCGHCQLHGAECVFARTDQPLPPRASAAATARRAVPQTRTPASTSARSSDHSPHSREKRPSAASRSNAFQPLPSPDGTRDERDDEDGDDAGQPGPGLGRISEITGTYTPRLSGRIMKTRLFGQSHWANNMVDQFKEVHQINLQIFFKSDSHLHSQLRKCKSVARSLKLRHVNAIKDTSSYPFSEVLTAIPQKEVADQLVETYLRTFESVLRILHIPAFKDECSRYWDNPSMATEAFVTKYLLVLAIGSCTYDNEPGGLKEKLRVAACRAILRGHALQCATVDKHRMTLDMIQVYCLVLLSRQTSAVEFGDDLIWISAGSLMHTAFVMGLHRDPGLFSGLTPYQIEMRRRLWATILEFVVQSSLDSGMPPMIGVDDYDCGPPSNINDSQICPDEAKSMLSPPLPDTVYTQTSCQRLLLRSLPLRLRVAKSLNGLNMDQSYDEALRLSRELTSACRTASALLDSMAKTTSRPSVECKKPGAFQTQLIDVLTRRFFHSLHAPYARKSLAHVQYYYSRRMHLDAAVHLVSILTGDTSLTARTGSAGVGTHSSASTPSVSSSTDRTDLELIGIHGRGLFKCVFIDACTTVVFEAINQLQEDPSQLGFDGSAAPLLSQRELLQQAVRSVAALGRRRLEQGETNFKAFCFHSCCLGQVEAMLAGRPVQDSIMAAAKESLAASLEILRDRAVRSGVVLPPDGIEGEQDRQDGVGENGLDVNGLGSVGSSVDGAHPAYARVGPPTMQMPLGSQDLLTMPGITVDFGSGDDDWMDFGLGVDFDSTPESWILSGMGSEVADGM